jgi:hypothetical protein
MTAAIAQFGVHIMIDGYSAPRDLQADRDDLMGVLMDFPVSIGLPKIDFRLSGAVIFILDRGLRYPAENHVAA